MKNLKRFIESLASLNFEWLKLYFSPTKISIQKIQFAIAYNKGIEPGRLHKRCCGQNDNHVDVQEQQCMGLEENEKW